MKRIAMSPRLAAWVAPMLLTLATAASAAELPGVASGRIERTEAFASKHVPARTVDVWLPDGYDGKRKHAVLYMHDGQMLFDASQTWNHQEWRADEIAGELIAAGAVRPFIIVGIWNAGAARVSEYFPQKPFETLTPEQQEVQFALKMGGSQPVFSGKVVSDAYLRFLVQELKPWVDRTWAVDPAREATFVSGSSMGGLISMYALSEYPEVFGGAACLSTHWPGTVGPEQDNPLPPAFFDYIRAQFPKAGRHKIYFDLGTETLDARYAGLQRDVDALRAEKGYTEADWLTRVYPGAEHSEKAWSARLDVPLKFLLGVD